MYLYEISTTQTQHDPELDALTAGAGLPRQVSVIVEAELLSPEGHAPHALVDWARRTWAPSVGGEGSVEIARYWPAVITAEGARPASASILSEHAL